MTGLAGQTTIDATNSFDGPREGFPSLAAEVKSIIGGPTAKSFNTNFASIYDQIASQRVRSSNVFASDPDTQRRSRAAIAPPRNWATSASRRE